jgi:hypothetical protein
MIIVSFLAAAAVLSFAEKMCGGAKNKSEVDGTSTASQSRNMFAYFFSVFEFRSFEVDRV